MNFKQYNSKTVNFLLLLISLFVFFFVFELVLKLFPVNNSSDWLSVTEKTPILRHTPNHYIIYSRDWNFSISNKRWSNNYGFINEQQYRPKDNKPLIAVIGDSYVEALPNSYASSFYGKLQSSLVNCRVYSFGVSGAPLSQYLAWAKFAQNEFNPQIMIIPIIANDFDESFYKYKKTRGFHYFIDEGKSNEILLHRVDRIDSSIRKLLFKSSLFRHLFFNLHIGSKFWELKNSFIKFIQNDKTPLRYIGNVPAIVTKEQEKDGRLATDLFLANLPVLSKINTSKILFIVDGIRPNLYAEEEYGRVGLSYWQKMHDYFIYRAKLAGYNVIDMQPVFTKHFNQHGKRFEYENDGHWNDLAHNLVAQQIINSKLLRDELSSSCFE